MLPTSLADCQNQGGQEDKSFANDVYGKRISHDWLRDTFLDWNQWHVSRSRYSSHQQMAWLVWSSWMLEYREINTSYCRFRHYRFYLHYRSYLAISWWNIELWILFSRFFHSGKYPCLLKILLFCSHFPIYECQHYSRIFSRLFFQVLFAVFIFFMPFYKTAENTLPSWFYGLLLIFFNVDSVSLILVTIWKMRLYRYLKKREESGSCAWQYLEPSSLHSRRLFIN